MIRLKYFVNCVFLVLFVPMALFKAGLWFVGFQMWLVWLEGCVDVLHGPGGLWWTPNAGSPLCRRNLAIFDPLINNSPRMAKKFRRLKCSFCSHTIFQILRVEA